MKKLLLPSLILASIILTWCTDFNQATQAKITELEIKGKIAQTACGELEKIEKDINSLKSYIWNQSVVAKRENCTQGYAVCIDVENNAIYEDICYEDFTLVSWSDYFPNYDSYYQSGSTNCLISTGEDALEQMLIERPIFSKSS